MDCSKRFLEGGCNVERYQLLVPIDVGFAHSNYINFFVVECYCNLFCFLVVVVFVDPVDVVRVYSEGVVGFGCVDAVAPW